MSLLSVLKDVDILGSENIVLVFGPCTDSPWVLNSKRAT